MLTKIHSATTSLTEYRMVCKTVHFVKWSIVAASFAMRGRGGRCCTVLIAHAPTDCEARLYRHRCASFTIE